MTQTAPSTAADRAAPFPAPPGLEHQAATGEAASTSLHHTVADLRHFLLSDMDSKVSEKLEEVWQRGRQMMSQVQQKQQEKVDSLSSELTRCLERQRALEVENEQLKQVFASLAGRLSLIGAAFSMPGTHCGGGCATLSPGSTTATGSRTPSTQTRSSSELFTPSGLTGAGDAFAPLPEVPAFPFPAPLSLAEALGAEPQLQLPTPLSLASSLPLGPMLEASLPYRELGGVASFVFSFTLRKADETDLGLNISFDDAKQVLRVEGVRVGGAVEAWNRQCAGGACPEKAVMPGDRIVGVNSLKGDADKMLEECAQRQLLRLTVVRGECIPEAPACIGSPARSKSLRAEASEFVPMSLSSPATPKVEL